MECSFRIFDFEYQDSIHYGDILSFELHWNTPSKGNFII